MITRAFFDSPIDAFLRMPTDAILGQIVDRDYHYDQNINQRNTWKTEIEILKRQLAGVEEGRILFEYSVPRMGKRVDVVILFRNIVYLLEFKCRDDEYKRSAYNQVYDYVLDLKSFHMESHDKLLACIMVSDEAETQELCIVEHERIIEPIKCNAENIRAAVDAVAARYEEPELDYLAWVNSVYKPTPSIVEAAQALYHGHNVEEISRNDAESTNLGVTTVAIEKIIEDSKKNGRKSICFVTGVPGAGKTLVGLNLAINYSNAEEGEHAVFLSGNQPLVTVLQHALARDKVSRAKEMGEKFTKTQALRETGAFIQIIHAYRDDCLVSAKPPAERVAIFDEAQRAWTKDCIQDFMKRKKGVADFDYSEPEFLISTMDRHHDWAVIVCLIGGGQEINRGEAGLPEWFDSLRRSFADWDVYVAPQLHDDEYRYGRDWNEMVQGLRVRELSELHLSVSMRSYRTPAVAGFVKAFLDRDMVTAKTLYDSIKEKYPIAVTRDLNAAKSWIRSRCKGTRRYGVLASSGALRLKPEGIFVKSDKQVENWFLNDADDVRSSYACEDVATEFEVQGLELDYTIVAWDADLRLVGNQWSYNAFKGDKWQRVNDGQKRRYLKNAYRVLLTRAREGMIIFVPKGCEDDITRPPSFYNELAESLCSLGVEMV
ncbi:MAG: DUF2075 domain-containing protein [Akkermansia sp.]|nr:DUF2075 domain-containing protein [Akkermansia sp.]